MRKLFNRDVEFVAHITPEGTQHLVVELARLVVGHQLRSLLQTLRGHFVGLACTTLGDVGILNGTLAEDDEQRDEHEGHNSQCNPIGRRTKEELVDALLTYVARLDITDVTTQFLQILLTRIVTHRTRTGTLRYIKRQRLAGNGPIGLGSRIEIGQADRRNLIVTLMTRHDEDVVNHRTLDARCGQFCLVSHLRLVFVEVLGQLNLRLLDEFQITRTTDSNAH